MPSRPLSRAPVWSAFLKGPEAGLCCSGPVWCITEDTVLLPQPGPPTSTMQPKESQAIATIMLSTLGLGPADVPLGQN